MCPFKIFSCKVELVRWKCSALSSVSIQDTWEGVLPIFSTSQQSTALSALRFTLSFNSIDQSVKGDKLAIITIRISGLLSST